MKAISFYIVGVINAADLNEAARILGPARKAFEEDGRILVLSTVSSVHELAQGEASAKAAERLQGAIDMALGGSARGWFQSLIDSAGADAEAQEATSCLQG